MILKVFFILFNLGEENENDVFEYIKNLYLDYDLSKRIIYTTKINFIVKDELEESIKIIFEKIGF
jgi:hypothetical protein